LHLFLLNKGLFGVEFGEAESVLVSPAEAKGNLLERGIDVLERVLQIPGLEAASGIGVAYVQLTELEHFLVMQAWHGATVQPNSMLFYQVDLGGCLSVVLLENAFQRTSLSNELMQSIGRHYKYCSFLLASVELLHDFDVNDWSISEGLSIQNFLKWIAHDQV